MFPISKLGTAHNTKMSMNVHNWRSFSKRLGIVFDNVKENVLSRESAVFRRSKE